MGFKLCPGCGFEIGLLVNTCPHCGKKQLRHPKESEVPTAPGITYQEGEDLVTLLQLQKEVELDSIRISNPENEDKYLEYKFNKITLGSGLHQIRIISDDKIEFRLASFQIEAERQVNLIGTGPTRDILDKKVGEVNGI